MGLNPSQPAGKRQQCMVQLGQHPQSCCMLMQAAVLLLPFQLPDLCKLEFSQPSHSWVYAKAIVCRLECILRKFARQSLHIFCRTAVAYMLCNAECCEEAPSRVDCMTVWTLIWHDKATACCHRVHPLALLIDMRSMGLHLMCAMAAAMRVCRSCSSHANLLQGRLSVLYPFARPSLGMASAPADACVVDLSREGGVLVMAMGCVSF